MSKLIFEMTGKKALDVLLTKINNGANINIQSNQGNTALILASDYGCIDICRLLIENGADINIQNKEGNIALILVSYGCSNMEFCKLLIENGADINIQNNHGETALMKTSRFGHIDICKYLIENGADINIKSNYGEIAIDIMKNEGIYKQVAPYKIIGLKYFQEVFKGHAEAYIDIFETILYSEELELDEIKANIDMFYSTINARMDNNAINEDLEL